MEILKRARGHSDGDVLSFNSHKNKKDVQGELNHRTWKAGYTDRDGQPKISRSNGAGKGDVPRPMNKKKYDENYERIFGKGE